MFSESHITDNNNLIIVQNTKNSIIQLALANQKKNVFTLTDQSTLSPDYGLRKPEK